MVEDQSGGAAPASSVLPSGDSVLTPQEVAALLRVSVDTVLKAVSAGELRAFRIGRLWRVSGSAVTEFMEGNSNVARLDTPSVSLDNGSRSSE